MLQVRHDNPERLKTLLNMSAILRVHLSKKIDLSLHDSLQDCMCGNKLSSRKSLLKGQTYKFWAGLSVQKLVKDIPSKLIKGAASLVGELQLVSLPGDGQKNLSIPVTLVGILPSEKEESSNKPKDKSEFDPLSLYEENLIKWLGTLSSKELLTTWQSLKAKLESHSESPRFKALYVQAFENQCTGSERSVSKLKEILSLNEELLKSIDRAELLEFTALKQLPEKSKKHEILNKYKKIFVESLHRKASLLLELYEAFKNNDEDSKELETTTSSLDSAIKELEKWEDLEKDPKYFDLLSYKNKPGKSLKTINKLISSDPKCGEKLFSQRIKVLKTLGWNNWVAYQEAWKLKSFPSKYQLF